MLRTFLPMGLLATLGFIGAAAAQTAPPPTPPRPGDPVRVAPASPSDTPHPYRAKQVLGAKVSLKGDLAIGTVDDVVFSDAGQIEYLIVANEGKLVTVPWEAAKFDFDKRMAVLSITQDRYKLIPTYTAREYPVYFEPTYRTQVYKYYDLSPRPWFGLRR